MTKEEDSRKDIFKQIFRDGWKSFKAKHPRYESVDKVVEKMLGCGEYENGYAVYQQFPLSRYSPHISYIRCKNSSIYSFFRQKLIENSTQTKRFLARTSKNMAKEAQTGKSLQR